MTAFYSFILWSYTRLHNQKSRTAKMFPKFFFSRNLSFCSYILDLWKKKLFLFWNSNRNAGPVIMTIITFILHWKCFLLLATLLNYLYHKWLTLREIQLFLAESVVVLIFLPYSLVILTFAWTIYYMLMYYSYNSEIVWPQGKDDSQHAL